VRDGRLRPIDLAREHGISAQAVRNYEKEGILPGAVRTPSGYRVYTPLHANALRAFVALVPAHGHRTASDVMRAANEGDLDVALALLDESHAQLLRDRETLAEVEAALQDLASPEPERPSQRGVAFIGGSRGNWGSDRRLCASGKGPVCSTPGGTRRPATGSTPPRTSGTRAWRTSSGAGVTCCDRSRPSWSRCATPGGSSP
jgi:DNA-binding transcriptional MerR regulator